MEQYLGVDIGGTFIKIGLINSELTVLTKEEYAANFDNYNTPLIDTVVKSIKLFLEKHQLDLKDISGIGVSATGQIDIASGKVIGVGGNIKNWLDTNIKDTLTTEFNLPVSVLNDADCLVLAESTKRQSKNMLGITIGTGVGGGIIVESEILKGDVGIAGEIGHMVIVHNGRECACGNKGCYERYASMSALIKDVKTALNTTENIDGRYIFNNLDNEVINKCVDEWLDYIASGIISLVHIFNCDLVVVGGGVSKQEELFIKPLSKKVYDRLMPRFKDNLKIEGSVFSNDGGMIGAVQYLKGMIVC